MKLFKNRLLKSFKGKGSDKEDADVNYSLMSQPDGNVLRSTDFLSSLDLLCEGEIEGFVNPDGALVEGIDVLQGVYLNDVPILEVENSSSVAVTQGPDTIAPQLLILGDNPTVIELGQESFVDEGAVSDEDLAVSAVNNVNDQVLGSYTVTYTASDASGNTTTVTRVVNVVDSQIPVITISGNNPLTVESGTVYTDAGATSDGPEAVTFIDNVNTNIVGTYQVIYFATDASGNTTSATRVVKVIDSQAPIITVSGENPIYITRDSTYTDAGATSPGEFVSATGTVDTSTEGTYTVTYSVTDAAGRTGTATRTVEVIGDNIITFAWGSDYNSDTWTYNSQENRYSYTPSSGYIKYLEKDSLNRWTLYDNVNANNPSGIIKFRTTSSYTSDVPLNIPYSDWVYNGTGSSGAQVGFFILASQYPSSSITLQGFYPDGSNSNSFPIVNFNGGYTFNSNDFTYTRTSDGVTHSIALQQNAGFNYTTGTIKTFRWIASEGGSIYFWSDDFDADTDMDNILNPSLGGFTNKIEFNPNFPQSVIGTIS
tara:strand:+ start:1209 stop:2828 length:1620 start_codon:yes stop_codon:yes gene_type:complete